MYPHFIEVTIFEGPKAIINIDQIKAVATLPDFYDGAVIYYSTAGNETVRESYDEVMQLLKDAGTHIQKPDPRLDTKNPLTMDELKRMIGEPVWNSNRRSWELVHYYEPVNNTIQVVDAAGKIYLMDEADLIKYPLYRMKNVSD